MIVKKCRTCGKRFVAECNKVFCSDPCRKKFRAEYMRRRRKAEKRLEERKGIKERYESNPVIIEARERFRRDYPGRCDGNCGKCFTQLCVFAGQKGLRL